jgi:glycosyltransferase involved in cell wall biosynthesis
MNVVIGKRMRDKLISEGVSPDKIQVIHNWADGKAIRPVASEENPLRREWGLEEKFIVGYSGNLGRAHEFKTVLGAAEKLKDEKQIVFLFIGGGTQIDLVKEEGRKLGLVNLMFKSYQPREMLNQSLGLPDVHLVVLRPEMEGLIVPSKFYGIAAAGKPAFFIGDKNGEIARILGKNEAGQSIAQGDSEALVNNIRVLKNDPDMLNRMGVNARTVFDKEFDMELALEKWEKVLRGLRTKG